ncbi:flagellar hook-associated protein FlgK [Candidatus Neomarinimicrobiota bacterium]
MAGLELLTEMGKQGMLLSQFGIQIAGKNISNVNTKGYSRQRLDVNPLLPEILGKFSFGSAINGDTLHRIRQNFVDRQFWSQSSLQSQYSAEDTLLRQVEGVLPSSNDTGLGTMLDEFWNAWNALANDPESSVARTIVRDRAQTLAQNFNRVYREFLSFQSTIEDEIKARVGEINELASQIAELNKVNPGNSLDLDDQRDRLVDRLAELVNVDVRRDGSDVSVYVSGLMLVSGRTSYAIATDESVDEDGISQISTLISGTSRTIDANSGELGALLAVHNQDIPDLLSRLDNLAVSLADAVNSIHQTGYNLDGFTGLDFFASTTEGAGSIAVNSAIVSDPELIATSDALGESGNANVAKALADLADADVVGNQSLGEYYRSLVGTLGNRIQETGFLKANQDKIVSNLEIQRQSISGVSMEEEMTRMVQLEQAFTAASRLVNVADELIQTVLQLL